MWGALEAGRGQVVQQRSHRESRRCSRLADGLSYPQHLVGDVAAGQGFLVIDHPSSIRTPELVEAPDGSMASTTLPADAHVHSEWSWDSGSDPASPGRMARTCEKAVRQLADPHQSKVVKVMRIRKLGADGPRFRGWCLRCKLDLCIQSNKPSTGNLRGPNSRQKLTLDLLESPYQTH